MFKSFFISILFEKRLTIVTMFLFTAAICNGQREQKNYLTPQQLAELHNELHKNIEDTPESGYYYEWPNITSKTDRMISISLTVLRNILET